MSAVKKVGQEAGAVRAGAGDGSRPSFFFFFFFLIENETRSFFELCGHLPFQVEKPREEAVSHLLPNRNY